MLFEAIDFVEAEVSTGLNPYSNGICSLRLNLN